MTYEVFNRILDVMTVARARKLELALINKNVQSAPVFLLNNLS